MASQVERIKWIPGTSFIVDGFRFQSPMCSAYFLTHFHSDHTTGLTRSFADGLIYCSRVTRDLLVHDMRLQPQLLRVLELDRPAVVDGVEVVALDANHCPGAVMLLFRVPQPDGPPRTILHTGDFRWDAELHGKHPLLDPALARIETLILDTTYCGKKWTFPPQREVVASLVELLRREAEADPATLFCCMSYRVGKEKAYLGAAAALGWRVWVPPAKRRVLALLQLPAAWMALLVDVQEAAQLHVLGMGEQMHEQALADRIAGSRWSRVVAIRPTGWTFRRSGKLDLRVDGCVTTVGVPYSEHSSYAELQDCVRTLRPRRLVPTVNAVDPEKSRALVDLLAEHMDLTGDKSRMDCYLRRSDQKDTAAPASAAGAGGCIYSGCIDSAVVGGDVAAGGFAAAIDAPAAPGAASQGRGLAEEDAGPALQAEEEDVDVTAVDAAEQRRIWDEIVLLNRKPGSAAKRQPSIKAWLTPKQGGHV